MTRNLNSNNSNLELEFQLLQYNVSVRSAAESDCKEIFISWGCYKIGN